MADYYRPTFSAIAFDVAATATYPSVTVVAANPFAITAADTVPVTGDSGTPDQAATMAMWGEDVVAGLGDPVGTPWAADVILTATDVTPLVNDWGSVSVEGATFALTAEDVVAEPGTITGTPTDAYFEIDAVDVTATVGHYPVPFTDPNNPRRPDAPVIDQHLCNG